MEETPRALRWMPLDNAGLIFPAALRRRWSNAYRISFTFRDPVDPALLQDALDAVAPRFPSICARLRRSAFWYYLEELERPPAVRQDAPQPLVGMTRADVHRCAVRVLYYRSRMAVEFFHAVTDGTGAMIFTKTLAAEYVRRRYGVSVPCEEGVLDPSEPPRPQELEDSFLENAGPVASPRDDRNVYRPGGTPEPDRFLHVTLGLVDGDALHTMARERGVTVTAFLTAVLLDALLAMQAEDVPQRRKRRPVKVQLPVNLRQLYGGQTLRNFVAVANVGVDPRMGDYDLGQLCRVIAAQLAAEGTPQQMAGRIAANVTPQQIPLIRVIPLALKNPVMRMIYNRRGESKGCINLSNLGQVKLPAAMVPWVKRMEFIIGTQRSYPNNCSVLSYGGKTCINMIRNIRESELERRFFSRLVALGIPVEIECNRRKPL